MERNFKNFKKVATKEWFIFLKELIEVNPDSVESKEFDEFCKNYKPYPDVQLFDENSLQILIFGLEDIYVDSGCINGEGILNFTDKETDKVKVMMKFLNVESIDVFIKSLERIKGLM